MTIRYVVQFAAYRDATTHAAAVGDALRLAGACEASWRVVPRANAASAQPTDFALLELATADEPEFRSILRALRSCAGVRRVAIDRSLTLATAAAPESAPPRARPGPPGVRERSPAIVARGASAAELLGAPSLWRHNHTGTGIRVAVFDSGLSAAGAMHIRNVESVLDWTDEAGADDALGHGTAVANLIGGSHPACPGAAPDATLLIYKVFTRAQASSTAWLLDALNHAKGSGAHLLNLSVGGPDFLDAVFVDKVRELSAAGIVIVSGAGNGGPLGGTLLNPADQPDVLAVGGLSANDEPSRIAAGLPPRLARFSARGPTAWEQPSGGAPRWKPDVLAPAVRISAPGADGECAAHTGTSFACPLVSGAAALLAAAACAPRAAGAPRAPGCGWLNPASLRQLLVASAQPLPDEGLNEQGGGALSLRAAAVQLRALLAVAPDGARAAPAAGAANDATRGAARGGEAVGYDATDDVADGEERVAARPPLGMPSLWPPALALAGPGRAGCAALAARVAAAAAAAAAPPRAAPRAEPGARAHALVGCVHEALYVGRQPVLLNVTVLNPLGARARFVGAPRWVPAGARASAPPAGDGAAFAAAESVRVRFVLPPDGVVWPWSGWIGLSITYESAEPASARANASGAGARFEGELCGAAELRLVTRRVSRSGAAQTIVSRLSLPLRAIVVRTPERHRRVLFDVRHSLSFPPGYVPRDDLAAPAVQMFDAAGADALGANFARVGEALRSRGYWLESLSCDLLCFRAEWYGTLLLVDSEDHFSAAEAAKLRTDVLHAGLSLVVLADWWQPTVARQLAFDDEGTAARWTPATGGANLPALNVLLAPFGIAFGEGALRGAIRGAAGVSAGYASGARLSRFPAFGQLLTARLADEGRFMAQHSLAHSAELEASLRVEGGVRADWAEEGTPLRYELVTAAVAGLAQFGVAPRHGATAQTARRSGRIAVFGDSSCADDAYDDARAHGGDCGWLVSELLEYAAMGTPPASLAAELLTLSSRYASDVPPARAERPRGSTSDVANGSGREVVADFAPAPQPSARGGSALWRRLRRGRAPAAAPARAQPVCGSRVGQPCAHRAWGLVQCEPIDGTAQPGDDADVVVFWPSVGSLSAQAAVVEPVNLAQPQRASRELDTDADTDAPPGRAPGARTPRGQLTSAAELLALPLFLLAVLACAAVALLAARLHRRRTRRRAALGASSDRPRAGAAFWSGRDRPRTVGALADAAMQLA
ncbi:hypothetical protein KFE25_008432 [Diacronema lutheri]|uniref:Peptidase S8/S53 domain-containing protein n=1 Tax=Diacronema lutheri TaxID=2081491 RepID=A0A8J5XD66_DIALT|nr:hypothetical protein KFE25_008432 [Diacronema lutheri]